MLSNVKVNNELLSNRFDNSQPNPNEARVILKAESYTLGTDACTLFKTKFFSIKVNPENQTVPGMLKIVPNLAQLGDWESWQASHWIELLQVVRLCELMLMRAFDAVSFPLTPAQDKKLINFFGKQRKILGKNSIIFEIVPRYENEIKLSDQRQDPVIDLSFKDELFGQPFDFSSLKQPSPELYQFLLEKLRRTLVETDFSSWILEDKFLSSESCFHCIAAAKHPEQTGLVEVSGFKLSLDARSQEEPGRAILDTANYGHVPALRYWKDDWMAEVGEIFAAYRATVNERYPSAENREFDCGCLMNLAKMPVGTHTHFHFIPRTPGGKNYGQDFAMDAATYVPINKLERNTIVSLFQQTIIQQLLKRQLKVAWPLGPTTLKDQSLVEKIQDNEAAFLKEELSKAIDHENYATQCSLLESLAEHYLRYEDKIAEVAMLLTTALAIFNKHQDQILENDLGTRLLQKMQSIEVDYLTHKVKVPYLKQKTDIGYGVNPRYKENLAAMRADCKTTVNAWLNLNAEEAIAELQQYSQLVTMQVISLLGNMIQECVELLQTPVPCEYAVIGTGSLAREEMTFYSDLEYFILLSENNEKNRQFFEHVSQLLEIKIIMLGETDPSYNRNLLPKNMSTPIKKGFSLDVHKQAGNKVNSLIGTPEELSRYQLPGKTFIHEPRNHLSSALVTGIFVVGSDQGLALYEQYNQCLENIFNAKAADDLQSLRQSRAVFLIKEDVAHFGTRLESGSENGKMFQVKNQLYRLPQTILDGLALYCNLKTASTWDRIEALVAQRRMTEQAGLKLKKLIGFSLLWRLKTYNHYGEQREFIDVLQNLSNSSFAKYHSENMGYSEQDAKDLAECYLILSSLEHSLAIFCESEDKDGILSLITLNTEECYSTQGKAAMRLCQYSKAILCFEKARQPYKEEKNKFYVVYTMELAYAHLAQGNAKQAVTIYEELINLLRTTPNDFGSPENILKAQYFLGVAWVAMSRSQSLAEYTQRAMDCFNTCLKGYIPLLGENHPRVAEVLASIGERQLYQGNYEVALQNFKRSLEINTRFYGPLSPLVADDLSCIGCVLAKMQKPHDAQSYLEAALKITKDLFGASHPNIANILASLSSCFEQFGDLKMAIAMLNSAVNINQSIYGAQHHTVINDAFKLTQLLSSIGDLNLAEKLLTELVTITRQAGNLEKLALCLNNLGAIFLNSERYDMALKCFEACRTTKKKIYNDIDERMASLCHNFSVVLRCKGQYVEAVKNLEEELHIYVSLKLLEKIQITELIVEMGETYKLIGDNNLGMQFIKRVDLVLQILSLKYGIDDPDILKCKAFLEDANKFFASSPSSRASISPNQAPSLNITMQYARHLGANVDAQGGRESSNQSANPFQNFGNQRK